MLKYIKNSLIETKVIKLPNQAEAIRVANYPYAAIEEAIVNAVYHRSYEIREPIEVRIHPDCIIITSYPGPDKSIRKQDLEKGIVVARRYRNRRIGECLKELHLTEGRAIGIPKILSSMRANQSPKPVFDTDEERSYFVVRLPINSYFVVEQKAQDEARDIKNKDKLQKYALNETERKVLELLFAKELSKKEIAEGLGYHSIPGHLKKVFDRLLANKLIEYTLPDKPKSKYQKYSVTTEISQDLKK